MKKTLALAAALTVLWTANSWAAATVNLNNYGAGAGAIFLNQDGTLAPLANTFVQILNAADRTPIQDTTGVAIIPLSEDGRFFGGTGVVPGLADNASASLILQAWTGAADFASASIRGESAPFTQATGAWNPAQVPPAVPSGPDLTNPSVTMVVPEPSTIALGLLGGAALLLFRRK
jgi:hypothetical protein